MSLIQTTNPIDGVVDDATGEYYCWKHHEFCKGTSSIVTEKTKPAGATCPVCRQCEQRAAKVTEVQATHYRCCWRDHPACAKVALGRVIEACDKALLPDGPYTDAVALERIEAILQGVV